MKSSCDYYIIIRRKALTGWAWLKAQGVGTVFEYEKERLAIEKDPVYRNSRRLVRLEWGVSYEMRGEPSIEAKFLVADLSDATCTVLCPAIGAKP